MEPARAIAGRITGYTRHGLEQAIQREGVGVHPRAILDTVRKPKRVVYQPGDRVQYVGEDAVVILNRAGKIITTWATHRAGYRVKQQEELS